MVLLKQLTFYIQFLPLKTFFSPNTFPPLLVPEGKFHLTDNVLNADLCRFFFTFISETIKIHNLWNWKL